MISAQEWVDRAIAAGVKPCVIRQPQGWALWRWQLDVDREIDPGLPPAVIEPEIFKILDGMGRCYDMTAQEATAS